MLLLHFINISEILSVGWVESFENVKMEIIKKYAK